MEFIQPAEENQFIGLSFLRHRILGKRSLLPHFPAEPEYHVLCGKQRLGIGIAEGLQNFKLLRKLSGRIGKGHGHINMYLRLKIFFGQGTLCI